MSDEKIIPFPVRRRKAWVRGQIARADSVQTGRYEWLAAQVDQYGEHLFELGVAESHVNREMDDLAVMLGLLPSPNETAKSL